MYQVIFTINISAPVGRVWRALCDPAEVVRWDTGVTRALDAPKDYPQPGQRVRWAYRSHLWPILHDRPQEVIPEQRLRSLLDLGPCSIDETYELHDAQAGCILKLKLALSIGLPFLGELLENFWVGPDTKRGFEASLESLKRYCEAPSPD